MKRASKLMLLVVLFSLMVFANSAHASDVNAGDTAFTLTASALVLLMTLPGLAMFYAGLVRAKNVLSVMMHCVSIAGLASVLWFTIGYSLAFAHGSALVGSLSKSFLLSVHRDSVTGTLP
jgi:Amt family ammonium transporter